MSTGYGGYSVVSPAVLERRALAAADARFERACEAADRLADEIAAARRSFGDLGVAVAPVARPAATSAAVEAAAEQVEAATREARRAFKTALAAGRSRAMTRSIATTSWLPAGKDTSADERRRRLAAARAATEAARREAVAAADRQAAERRDEIERVVARLPADVDGEVAARAESAAAAALAATGPNAYRAAADDLRATVQLARDVDRDRRSRLAEVDGLRRQLDGLDSPAVTALRRRLDAVDGRDPLPDGLPGQVAQAVAAARAESDRRFVFDAVAATFDELGYEVDEGFATAVAAGGAVLTLPWSGDHGVRVRARDGNLLFNVVRYDDGDDTGDEATDTHAESAFCDGYERLQAVARRHGVEIDVDDPQPPGHRPLQRVAAPRPADAIRVEAEADDAAGRARTEARMIDRPLPAWAEEMATLLPACAHFMLSGNVRDLYLVEAGLVDEPDLDPHERVLVDLPIVVEALLTRRGVPALVSFDITLGASALPDTEEGRARAEAALGSPLEQLARQPSLTALADLIEATAGADLPVGLLIRSGSRLVRTTAQLSDREFEFFRRVERVAREAQPGGNDLFNPVVWAVDREQDLPAWFMARNEKLRSLVVPLPDTGDRAAAAGLLVDPDAQATLAEHTAGLTLVAMESVVGVARDQGMGVEGIEDAARAYRVGILDNPWRQPYLTERLQAELVRLDADTDVDVDTGSDTDAPATSATSAASEPLVERVLGQEPAVRKALDILVRSVTGLTAAHTTTGSRPRGVLFFAGPTGVGKTELAKALTRLIFDDERLYIRFDMSEFSAEHAADRLIGAPPGYTGYERGGELTNAVRLQPFSLVLFDEIEKADPLVLDKFLQLLDDGRLTDGRGETAYFTEAVVVFTSNLGIYKDHVRTDEQGRQTIERTLEVDPAKHEPDEVVRKVKAGIVEHFTLRLGRPELLNRIGDDNIVVFDFIRRPTGARILRKMVGNVLTRVLDEHQLDVTVGAAADETLAQQCLDPVVLRMGGRGIGARLESVLVNPLAIALFLERSRLGDKAELVDLLPQGGGAWHAVLRSA